MNTNEIIEAAQTLIRIPSTAANPGALQEALDFVASIIEERCPDATIEYFERGGKPSLLAYRSGERPEKFHIILNGHVDVVSAKPEQFQAYIADDRLYGRGAYDMKAAVIILTDVFCEYVQRAPYALGLQIVTDEESSGTHGTQYQVEQGVRADFVISGDCGRLPGSYEIANEAKGIAVILVAFQGSSAHGAYPWRGENAALKAARFVTRLHEFYPTPDEETEGTTMTVTSIISSSNSYSQIPGYATAHVDCRFAPDDPRFKTKDDVVALIKQIDPEAEVRCFEAFSAPIQTSPHNPLLLALKASAERVESHEFSFVRRNGTSDGRFFGEVGNEACDFGITGAHQHADDEYVTIAACAAYHATMRDFLAKTMTEQQIAEDALAIDRSASV